MSHVTTHPKNMDDAQQAAASHYVSLNRHIVSMLNSNATFMHDLQVRLLMSYVITHPEKMDDARQQQWQRLAHLTDMDMNTINNLELLGVPVKKKGNAKTSLGLNFGRKRKRAVRKVGMLCCV